MFFARLLMENMACCVACALATEERNMRACLTKVHVLSLGAFALGAASALDTALAEERCSTAMVRGAYAVYGQGTVFVGSPPQPGLEVDVGLAAIDGKGNMTGSITFSFNGTIFRTKYIGSYLVNSDCTITLTTHDDLGETLQQEGVVLDNGDEIRFIGTDPGRVIARVAQRLNN
jgi:hypothetical protein